MSRWFVSALANIVELVAINSCTDSLTHRERVKGMFRKVQIECDDVVWREPVVIVYRVTAHERFVDVWGKQPRPVHSALREQQVSASIRVEGGVTYFVDVWLTRLPEMRITIENIELRRKRLEQVRAGADRVRVRVGDRILTLDQRCCGRIYVCPPKYHRSGDDGCLSVTTTV